jgi:hypothetical protein
MTSIAANIATRLIGPETVVGLHFLGTHAATTILGDGLEETGALMPLKMLPPPRWATKKRKTAPCSAVGTNGAAGRTISSCLTQSAAANLCCIFHHCKSDSWRRLVSNIRSNFHIGSRHTDSVAQRCRSGRNLELPRPGRFRNRHHYISTSSTVDSGSQNRQRSGLVGKTPSMLRSSASSKSKKSGSHSVVDFTRHREGMSGGRCGQQPPLWVTDSTELTPRRPRQ